MDTASRHRISYLLSVWVEHTNDDLPMWRGVLVTAAGQRLHFSTLAQLDRWLCELTGWQDPPSESMAKREEQAS
jgi:hypothetical protein